MNESKIIELLIIMKTEAKKYKTFLCAQKNEKLVIITNNKSDKRF